MAARLPTLRGIEAFVAAAHALSFTVAAARLNLSVSAVSRRVASLEEALEVVLFHRFNRALRLTTAGKRYLAALEPALDQLAEASDAIRPPRGDRQLLKIDVLQSFAVLWLLPRLDRFAAAHQGIELRLSTSGGKPDLRRDGVDAAIRIAEAPPGGMSGDRLLELRCTPVAMPALVNGKPGLRKPDDIAQHVLLGLVRPRGFWEAWLKAAKVKPFKARGTARFDSLHLLYEAAANGMGVALAFDALAEPYLRDRRLVAPFDLSVKLPHSYWLMYRAGAADKKPLAVFRRWLKAEIARVQ
jgi:LysR family glycine cleavage system transcriptional activator